MATTWSPSATTIRATSLANDLQDLGDAYLQTGNPIVGWFLSADPAMSDSTAYGYAYGNPLRYVDASGYEAEDAGAASVIITASSGGRHSVGTAITQSPGQADRLAGDILTYNLRYPGVQIPAEDLTGGALVHPFLLWNLSVGRMNEAVSIANDFAQAIAESEAFWAQEAANSD